jgi:hypothetical protein
LFKKGNSILLNAEVTTQDLFRACESLFGTDIDVSVEFLRYLQPAGVKAAFRKKALETHPDRAATLCDEVLSLESRFKEINLAYQLLSEFISCPEKYQLDEDGSISERKIWTPRPRSAARKYYAGNKSHNETKYNGRVPQSKLRLGQFLYYSGHISLTTLIKAIVWQRLQRPAIGSIATTWDWLDHESILEILQQRDYGEKFGECALRHGYISKYQLMLLLDRQKILQPQIGRYFVEQRIISSFKLNKMIDDMKQHNRKFWSF